MLDEIPSLINYSDMSAFNPPKSQGLKSSTFTQPPSDPTLSFPALYDWQGEHSPDHPLFLFEEAPGSKRTIKWGEAVQGFHRATGYVRETVRYSGAGSKPFIAVLATSGEQLLIICCPDSIQSDENT